MRRIPMDRREGMKFFFQLLSSKPVRNAIVNNVLRDRSVGVELTHQLYVFQRLMLNVLEIRAEMKVTVLFYGLEKDSLRFLSAVSGANQ